MSESSSIQAVHLLRDDAYLREDYLQWMFFRSRWRRWFVLLAVFAIVIGLWVLLAKPEGGNARVSAVVMIAVGMYELLSAALGFYRWKREVLAGRSLLPGLSLSLKNGMLLFGTGSDEGLSPIVSTVRVWRGVFLYTDKGRHVYVPNRWMKRAEVQQMLHILAMQEKLP